jgi:hypothetical protein
LTPPLDQRTINSDHLSDSVIMAIPARWYLPASPGAGFFLCAEHDRQLGGGSPLPSLMVAKG